MPHFVDTDDPVQRVLLGLLAVAVAFLTTTYLFPGMYVTRRPATAQTAPSSAPAITSEALPTVITGGAVDLGLGSGAPASEPAASADVPGSDLGATAALAFTVVNTGAEPDRLLGASDDLGGDVALVERTGDDSDATTRPLPGGLEIPAGASVTLDPDRTHLLLTGITKAEHKGDAFRVTLRFERAGEVVVPVQVRKSADKAQANAAAPVSAGALRIENAWARAADKSDLRPAGSAGATPAADKGRAKSGGHKKDATPAAAS